MSQKSRKALVTGAFGFSGLHLLKRLLEDGYQVFATDLGDALESPDRLQVANSIGLNIHHPGLTLVAADLMQPVTIIQLLKTSGPVDVLFHLASLYNYSASLDALFRINVTGTQNLLSLLKEYKPAHLVHFSTCGVFGKPIKNGKHCNIPFTENSSSPRNVPPGADGPLNTKLVNEYSISKFKQEQLVWNFASENEVPVTVLRPAPIYGPGSTYGHGGIIKVIADGLLPAIPADARNYINASVHVGDLVKFAAFVAVEPDHFGQDYNVADSSVISYFDFLSYIALLTGRDFIEIPLSLDLVRPALVGTAGVMTWLERNLFLPRIRVLEVQSAQYIGSSYWISNQKVLSTGYEFEYASVKEGLKNTVTWFKSQGLIH